MVCHLCDMSHRKVFFILLAMRFVSMVVRPFKICVL
jgi:hypothetical protein